MNEKLVCPECRNIILEGEREKLIKLLEKDKYIQCPYCLVYWGNPYGNREKE